MRSHRARSVIAVTTLVLALVAWLPGAAVGAEDSFRASGEASGFAVNVPEVTEIATGRSEAEITSDAFAHARGVGVLLADGSVSEVTIEESGVTQRDPESGQNCATPQLPAPFDIVDAACSFALGNTVGSPRGLADATGLELEVTGADVTALVAFLLSHITGSELQTAIDEVEAAVIGPVTDGLAEACLQGTSALQPLYGTAQDLIAAIEEEGGDIVNVASPDEACALLVAYITDPPVLVDEDGDGQAGADDVLTLLQKELAAALDGVSLLDVLLGGSVSEGVATDASATGTSDATGLDIALPSLNLLGNVLNVLTETVNGFLAEVTGDVEGIIDPAVLDALPDANTLVDTLMGAIPQELQDVLGDQDPLLQITGGKSTATAVYDRVAGEVTTEGQVQPLVLDLADSLAALLQLSDQDPFSVPEGDSVTIAEGTPLESTAQLATCTSTEASQDGLDGKRISCAGLDLTLLKGVIGDDPETEELDGGINVAGARAEAAAFGAPAPEEPASAPPSLPTTGGGAGLIGMVILGSVLALRRRR